MSLFFKCQKLLEKILSKTPTWPAYADIFVVAGNVSNNLVEKIKILSNGTGAEVKKIFKWVNANSN